jgi:molybdopterin synthase catalytic subunit
MDLNKTIEITENPISPETVINRAKTTGSGCVVTYVGLIRDNSQGKRVKSVEYRDIDGSAKKKLQEIAREVQEKWDIEGIAISHRTGILKVGDINLTVAIASAHRDEGFAACQHVINQFKSRLPTLKEEKYLE